jgi:hypothetical protein
LEDCVPSLSPAGLKPQLSPYWIDHAISGLSAQGSDDRVFASGNAWSLIRSGGEVRVRFDYGDQEDDSETVPVAELVAGLAAYREAVVGAIKEGHELDDRRWAQKNPLQRPDSTPQA